MKYSIAPFYKNSRTVYNLAMQGEKKKGRAVNKTVNPWCPTAKIKHRPRSHGVQGRTLATKIYENNII